MYRKYGDVLTPWAILGADTLLEREPNINPHFKWEYEDGLTLEGLYSIYKKTGDKRYLDYIKTNIDQFVKSDGTIQGYNFDEYNLDHVNNGKIVLDLWEEFHEERYKAAAELLFSQLLVHPRLNDGTFWHKKIYPYQCWLDGLYMGSVFYARYMSLFGEKDCALTSQNLNNSNFESLPTPGTFQDAALQFLNAYSNTVDAKTGLCYHVYDEAREQPWADKKTGLSPHFWLRSIGWFVMSMVDVLEYLPETLPEKEQIRENLEKLFNALIIHADKKTGLWFQIVDQGDRIGNYLESSGSFMLIAALAKSIRLGYLARTPNQNENMSDLRSQSQFVGNLSERAQHASLSGLDGTNCALTSANLNNSDFEAALNKAWENAIEQFLTIKNFGSDIHQNRDTKWVNVNKMCQMAGLGGAFPGRDGSFAYYIETPIVANDHKGYGPFLLAAAEMMLESR